MGSFCYHSSAPQLSQRADASDVPILREVSEPLKSFDARLFNAIRYGDLKKVGLLLSKGADPNAQDEQNTSALQLATDAPNNSLKIVQLLLAHKANINYRGLAGGSTLLMSAVTHHSANLDLLKFLLDHGANVNLPNFLGETALSLAVRASASDSVALLIQRGADVNPPDRSVTFDFSTDVRGLAFFGGGNTPVFELVRNWNPKIFGLLLDAGVKLNTHDAEGFNLIHYAVWDNNVDVVRILASKGVDVNAAANQGYTPLHFAIANAPRLPDPEVIESLLKAGANPSLKNKSGKTAEDLLRDFVKDRGFVDLGNKLLAELDPSASPYHSGKE